MKEIRYQIEFYSDWHCGSGLAAGADVDALVIKDKNGLPFVPGKTLKGLIREAAKQILSLSNQLEAKKDCLVQTFGYSKDEDLLAETDISDKVRQGEAFFCNAELPEKQRLFITENRLSEYLFRSAASTAIEKTGVAKDNSLRRMETTVPCILHGKIINVPDDFVGEIRKALKYIKRLGQSRHRGLGRCNITIQEGGNS